MGHRRHMLASLHGIALVTGPALLAGCTTTNHYDDPFEGINRRIFAFNEAVDRSALRPAARVYTRVTPEFLQTGVHNFFGNLEDLWSSVNNLAQLKGESGLNDLTRFAVNSTFGLFGILDIASSTGLQKHHEDLGQTLGYWGIPSGPYLVLPLLGPSTVRDAIALPIDLAADPWQQVSDVPWRNAGIAVRIVDQRSDILSVSDLVEDAALDRYQFIRDAYLQHRNALVLDTDSAIRRAAASSKSQRLLDTK
jgi:phospholipid-binding lipoprotein MlaA